MFRWSRVRLYVVPIGVLLLLVGLMCFATAAFAAPANPTGLTAQSCGFGSTWTDGLSRWIFGASMVFLALAAVAGGLALRSGGGGGGEVVGGAIGGVAGMGIVLGILGAVGLFSAIALAAAGAPACP